MEGIATSRMHQTASEAVVAQGERGVAGVLDLIGSTPLLRIERVAADLANVEIYAKAEWCNPGGSVKDRPALSMIQAGLAKGDLHPGKTILDAAAVKTLAELPSLDQLRAKLVGMIQTPATRIAGVLKAPGGQLARVLNAYATKDMAA